MSEKWNSFVNGKNIFEVLHYVKFTTISDRQTLDESFVF